MRGPSMTVPYGPEMRQLLMSAIGDARNMTDRRARPGCLAAAEREVADAEASDIRRSQIRTVDRSERIRTYNYPENRISDHRVNYKSNNLDAVLNGDLDEMIQALLDADKAARLANTK